MALGTMRRQLRFENPKAVAEEAGLLGVRARALDSTPIYDAVATEDTVTQLRSVIRKLLRVLALQASGLAVKVRAALSRDDDYATAGKPPCDWDDGEAREALVDALVRDARAALAALEGETLEGAAKDAAELLTRSTTCSPIMPTTGTSRRCPPTRPTPWRARSPNFTTPATR